MTDPKAANPGNNAPNLGKPDPKPHLLNHSEISEERKPAQAQAATNMQTSAGKEEVKNEMEQKALAAKANIEVKQPPSTPADKKLEDAVKPPAPGLAQGVRNEQVKTGEKEPSHVGGQPGVPLESFLKEWASDHLCAHAMNEAGWKGGEFPFCRKQLNELAVALRERGYVQK